MTGLKALLAEPERLTAPLKTSAFHPKRLARAVAELPERGTTAWRTEDVAALQARLVRLAAGDGEPSKRDLRRGCQAYLHAPDPPGRRADVARWLLGKVAAAPARQKRGPISALVDAYLDGFAQEDRAVEELALWLEDQRVSRPEVLRDPWPDRAERFALFRPGEAPGRLARQALDGDDAPGDRLKAAGLDTEHRRRGRLAEAAFRAGCGEVRAKPRELLTGAQRRLIEWACPTGAGASLLWPRAWPDFAEALLGPWGQTTPAKLHQQRLVEVTTGYAGDPRVSPARWSPVKDRVPHAYDIIVRWLTQASVEQFFDIVDQTADRQMWAARRRFWTSYLEKKHIRAAWVAFGADGARRAADAARRSNDPALGMFGVFSPGGGRTPQQAALIMQIGDLTIVDWSHNGRWNMWKRGERGHPALFRYKSPGGFDYHPSELMNAPTSAPHLGDWQSRLAYLIHTETGVRP